MPALIEMLTYSRHQLYSACCSCKQWDTKSSCVSMHACRGQGCSCMHERPPHPCSKSPVMTASMYALSLPLGVAMTTGCLSRAALKPASKVPPENRGRSLLSVLPAECTSVARLSAHNSVEPASLPACRMLVLEGWHGYSIALYCAQHTFLLARVHLSEVLAVAEAQTERWLPGQGPRCSLGLKPAARSTLSTAPGKSTAGQMNSTQGNRKGSQQCVLQSYSSCRHPRAQCDCRGKD